MPDNKSPVERIKKVAKVVWRHFFTAAIFAIIFPVFIKGPLNWENVFYMLSIAALVDWVKQFIKLSPNTSRCHTDDVPLHSRQPWNSSIIGTPTNLMNIGHNRYD